MYTNTNTTHTYAYVHKYVTFWIFTEILSIQQNDIIQPTKQEEHIFFCFAFLFDFPFSFLFFNSIKLYMLLYHLYIRYVFLVSLLCCLFFYFYFHVSFYRQKKMKENLSIFLYLLNLYVNVCRW